MRFMFRWGFAVSVWCGVPSAAAARQAPAPSRLVLGAGAGLMEFDASNDRAFRGLVLRAGTAPAWYADLAVVSQYWPDLGVWRGGTVLIEGTLYPAGRGPLTPYLELGAGYFRATDRLSVGAATRAGFSATVGVGVASWVAGPWGVRADGAVRLDPHLFDDEVRVALFRSPRLARPPNLLGGGAAAGIYGLASFTGPWKPVEPGYGFRFTVPVSGSHEIGTDLVLVHWRTVGNDFFTGWDTRAVFALPALAGVFGSADTRGFVAAGPLAVLMAEGPDDGVHGGVHAGAGVSAALGSGLVGTVGARLFWLVRTPDTRGAGPSVVPDTDERGVLFSLGFGY